MSSLPVLDATNRWTAAQWPSDTACEELKMPSTPTPPDVEPLSNLTSDDERPFEMLIPEVLQLLIQDGEKSTVIIRDALRAEQKWQRRLSDRLTEEHSTFSTLQTEGSYIQKMSDLVPTLSLAASGAVSLIAAGGDPYLSLGVIALGGLLALDTILDNKIKMALVSWLGARSESDSKPWLQKICVVTNFVVFGLSLCVNNRGLQVAQGAAGFVADTAEAKMKYSLDQQMARLTESRREWETSRNRLEELFGDAGFQMQTITSLYEMLTDLQRSTAQATNRIFRS
jgi:hypothetical protein